MGFMVLTTVSQTASVICLELTTPALLSLLSSSYMHAAKFSGDFGLLFL